MGERELCKLTLGLIDCLHRYRRHEEGYVIEPKLNLSCEEKLGAGYYCITVDSVPMLDIPMDKLMKISNVYCGFYSKEKYGECLFFIRFDINYLNQVSWRTFPVEERIEEVTYFWDLNLQHSGRTVTEKCGVSLFTDEEGTDFKFEYGNNWHNNTLWDGFMTSSWEGHNYSDKDSSYGVVKHERYRSQDKRVVSA